MGRDDCTSEGAKVGLESEGRGGGYGQGCVRRVQNQRDVGVSDDVREFSSSEFRVQGYDDSAGAENGEVGDNELGAVGGP